ncbi:MAG: protein-arginine deiminase family protein, partial [Planctomycetota bacterium]
EDTEVQRSATVRISDPSSLISLVDIDGDTDQTGTIDGTLTEEMKEHDYPGMIVLPNYDDDDAVSAGTMVPDSSNDIIDGGGDSNDILPLIVRQKADLAATDEVAILVPDSRAANIRIFPAIADSAVAIIDTSHGSVVSIGGTQYREAVLDSNAIRAGDVMLGIEGVISAQNATITASLRDATSKAEHDNDSLLVTVAPVIMMSNLEGTQRLFVSDGDSAFATAIRSAVMAATGSDLTTTLAYNGDVWVQDEFQAMYALAPARRIPMIQDTARNGPLNPYGESICFQFNYAHLTEGSSGSSPDFGGNMEVSPPVPGYPAGVIYSSTALSTGMQTFYNSQRVQTLNTGQILRLDANWLLVGHIDEFVGFIPMPATPDTTDFRLLMASPAAAKAILDDLAAQGYGTTSVFIGKLDMNNNPVETTVSALIADGALWTYNRARQVNCDTGRDLLISSLGLTDCITTPVAGGANTGTGALSRAKMFWPYHTMGTTVQWRLTFTSSTAFNFEYDAGLGWTADGAGDRSTDSLSTSKAIAIPSNYWTGTPNTGDTFTFTTTTNSQVIDLPVFFEDFLAMGALSKSPDVVNLQVVSGHLLVCEVFGPEIGGQDQFELFMSNALSHTGCTIHYIDDWNSYHRMEGEIHCGTEVIRVPRAEFKWWGP